MQITVRGSAEVSAEPQLGVLHLSVQLSGADKKQVVSEVISGANQVRGGVDVLPDAMVSEFVVESLQTSSHTPRDDHGNLLPTRHIARIPIRVTFTDFAELSTFAATQGRRADVVLHQVVWDLTTDARQELEVRALAQAVATARTRAIIMSSASGFSEVTPIAVADPNLLDVSTSLEAGAPMASMARSGSSGSDLDPEALDLRPEDVKLSATVDARFAAS